MTGSSSSWWVEGLTQECVQFQLDLSCLVDGELEDEIAAGRAVGHLEGCAACREFFEDARRQVRAHRDVEDPDALVRRYRDLMGVAPEDEVETIELVCRLSQIFYQLGKAYVLAELSTAHRNHVFEAAVPLESTRTKGRGFVDGVLSSGRAGAGVDWTTARHLFNGKLSEIEGALEKGVRLLQEAVAANPEHDEARIYLAFVDAHRGRTLRAAREFRNVFRTAVSPLNRGHAAMQLARLHSKEGEFRSAIACCRWVVQSGLADFEDRFFVAHFNLGMYWAHLRRPDRSVAAFRDLLDRHPGRAAEVAGFFARSPKLQAVIDSQPGFPQRLLEACPELFQPPTDPTGRSEDQAR